jgi:hypothetical protein
MAEKIQHNPDYCTKNIHHVKQKRVAYSIILEREKFATLYKYLYNLVHGLLGTGRRRTSGFFKAFLDRVSRGTF